MNHPRRVRGVVAGAATAVMVAACSATPANDEPKGGPAPEQSNSSTQSPETTDSPAGEVTVGETIASNLHTPWDVDFLADGTALVTLRDTGEVLRIDEGGTTVVEAEGDEGAVPEVQHASEDGLLGLAIGPDDGIYMYFTTDTDNRVVRYELDGDSLVNPEVILERIPSHENHSGGRLAFGPDGYLYVTTGDTRDLDLPQDTSSLAGKILRVTGAGEPAPGNPFDNEVWSYGHRNVQGLGWTSDGTMYASEFGSSEFDELNLIEPGGNYGWPYIEGWEDDSNYINPLITWTTEEASPSGISVTDDGIWMTALRGERLWYVPLGPDGKVGEPRDYQLGLGRLRAAVTTPDDELWVVTSNTDGRGDPSASDDRIVRLELD